MVTIPGRRSVREPEPVSIGSRLLPDLLDEDKLAEKEPVTILDFGRANSRSLEFFNRFPCRLSVLDAAEGLLAWSDRLEARLEEPPSQQQMELELGGILSALDCGYRYDLVFLWDTLNHLHEHALPAFASLLRKHLKADFRGHGFMIHKRGTEQQLRHMGLSGSDLIQVHDQSAAELYAHNRKVVNEALGRDLLIDHGVLHGDGRLEFLLVAGRSSKPAA